MIVRGITTLNFALLLIDMSPFGPGFYGALELVHLDAVPVYWVGSSTLALVIIVIMEIIEALRQRINVAPDAVPRLVKRGISIDASLSGGLAGYFLSGDCTFSRQGRAVASPTREYIIPSGNPGICPARPPSGSSPATSATPSRATRFARSVRAKKAKRLLTS